MGDIPSAPETMLRSNAAGTDPYDAARNNATRATEGELSSGTLQVNMNKSWLEVDMTWFNIAAATKSNNGNK